MDEVKAVLEFFATVGVLPVLCYLLWRLLITSQKALEDERKRSADLVQKMAEIVSAQENNLERRLQQYQISLDLQKQGFDLLKEAVFKVDGERKTAIAENMSAIQNTTGALVTFRDETVKAFDAAVNQMVKARAQTVNDINAHTDEAHRLTGVAIDGAQRANEAQHVGQGVDFKKMVDENASRINAHTDEAVEHNGDATRKLIIEQLQSINDRLDTMQRTAEQKDSVMAQQLHQLSTDLSKAVLLITAPKPEPPAVPAPTLPPVDPLANIPPKSEEMK